jgi:RNA polymerase primary sigma factor
MMIVLKNDQKNSAVLKSNGNPYLKQIGLHPYLTREKQDELYAKLDALYPDRLANGELGDIPDHCKPICWEIAGYMLKLVISVARKYKDRAGKLTFDDLIQEGNIGLLKGIWLFDNRMNVKLSTYATYWIWQSIGRAISNSSETINLNYQARKEHALACQFIDEYKGENGDMPSADEIARHLGISMKRMKNIVNVANVMQTVSLDDGYEEDDAPMHHLSIETDFNNDASLLELADDIDDVLGRLSAREERVIRLRFGLNLSQGTLNLKEIGEKFNLTRERIRQIEAEALKKMRNELSLEEYA